MPCPHFALTIFERPLLWLYCSLIAFIPSSNMSNTGQCSAEGESRDDLADGSTSGNPFGKLDGEGRKRTVLRLTIHSSPTSRSSKPCRDPCHLRESSSRPAASYGNLSPRW